MGKCKRRIAIVFCCSTLLVRPAVAFWPVIDFGEIIPIVSNVTTSLNSLSQTKEQLKQLKDGLKAIGDSIDNIAQFSQDLRNNLNDIADIANDSVGVVNDSLGTNIDVQNGLTQAIDKVNQTQTDIAGELVGQTQGAIDKGIGAGDKVTSGIEGAQNAGSKAEDFLNKAEEKANKDKDKENGTGGTTPSEEEPVVVEEEEEEEEIAETDSIISLQEEIKAGFEAVKDENKKLAEQLNDAMDTSLNLLNRAAEENRLVLDNLKTAVARAENIKDSDKKELQKQISQLLDKLQMLSDRNSAVIEAAKEAYNTEYREKIADGIGNYEKTVDRYLRGDASKEEVITAGAKLKADAASVNASPDAGTLNELKQEAEKIKQEATALKDAIIEAGKNGENNL